MEKYIVKQCKIHGMATFTYQKDRNSYHYRCNKCNSDHVIKRRKKLKTLAIEYKGGCCSKCGYKKNIKALAFHHTDSNEKDFGISFGGLAHSWEKVKKELDKCVLVCLNCHAEIHDELYITGV